MLNAEEIANMSGKDFNTVLKTLNMTIGQFVNAIDYWETRDF